MSNTTRPTTPAEMMIWNAKRERDSAVRRLDAIIRDLTDAKASIDRWEPGQAMAVGLHNASSELTRVVIKLGVAEGMGDSAQILTDFDS